MTQKQGKFEFDHSVVEGTTKKLRRGPPNRMNDLVYRDWMKFQKSFFRLSSDQTLVEDCVYFFTKSVWKDGTESRTLIVGVEDFSSEGVPPPRILRHIHEHDSFEAVIRCIDDETRNKGEHDFVLVDFRALIKHQTDLERFVTGHAEEFFAGLRAGLKPDRYGCVIVGLSENGGGGFPLPWTVAQTGRRHLRLRDEKIGLITETGRVVYCIFLQANDDAMPGREIISPTQFCLADDKNRRDIPAWIIPKPPPRRKNEILHPAKFPETLIEQLIETFTLKGDTVFDPMVGTGSTVIAAMRTMRHAYGVDLSAQYIRTSEERIEQERIPSLFPRDYTTAEVFVGDATRLEEIPGLHGLRFRYVVTSPPYWSMLTNPGSENQKVRRDRNLPLVYSDDKRDLGNISDYDKFLSILENIYEEIAKRLLDHGTLTVVVKNIKREHTVYPLAWDLAMRLCAPDAPYRYLGSTLWCQDDIGLKPFAVGIYWVSNILHTYCLHFQKR